MEHNSPDNVHREDMSTDDVDSDASTVSLYGHEQVVNSGGTHTVVSGLRLMTYTFQHGL